MRPGSRYHQAPAGHGFAGPRLAGAQSAIQSHLVGCDRRAMGRESQAKAAEILRVEPSYTTSGGRLGPSTAGRETSFWAAQSGGEVEVRDIASTPYKARLTSERT